ncbi:endonuclease/exonuclease/phosphatase family protein [Terrabacter sp. GCM10028922]|uniref:endonuclease/exonuclease/phosphatase family protein n=1 Tax=Terrabacter sp. GCM10028922 TaxID=3273428 RepID=UPI00361E7397
MRVVTWNLRTDTAVDPPHWPDRLTDVVAVLTELDPQVLGTQEGSAAMLDDLVAALPDRYAWVGEGRGGGRRDELTAVVYDTDRLDLSGWATRWLSETPDLAGSRSWGSAYPRTSTTVSLRDRRDGTAYTVVNTHLDNVSGEARRRSAARIAATLPAGPAVVMGDFNSPAAVGDEDGPYAALTGAGLVDALALHEPEGGWVGTFPDFDEPVVGAARIDWVLVSRDLRVDAARVVVDGALRVAAAQGRYASDHLPLVVDVAPT